MLLQFSKGQLLIQGMRLERALNSISTETEKPKFKQVEEHALH